MNIKKALTALLLLLPLIGSAAEGVDVLRGQTPLDETSHPPLLVNPDNSDVRRSRNYAMQPPVIPHKIESYQLDKNANKCMMCHARTRTQESQAPMVSVTHFMDRQGNFLAELSPRRYFCLQCHVPQAELKPLVDNEFIDVDTMLSKPAKTSAAQSRKK